MKNIGIFYGSSTGVCASLAQSLSEKLGVNSQEVHDVSSANPEDVAKYDVLFLGSSTWGCGDLQDDWYGFLDKLKKQNLNGKTVCLFGCGDAAMYSDTFCDAMAHLKEGLQGTGCVFAGNTVDADDYSYEGSASVENGCFIGLALDDNNEPDMHNARMDKWIESLKSVLN